MNRSIADRYAGALFGVAVGDALGGTLEFMTPKEIQQAYGELREIVGGGVWNLEAGETTDDTAMTLAVARGILGNPSEPLPEIAKEFVAWMKTNPKDVGNIIRTTLREGMRQGAVTEQEWQKAAERAHYANGGKSAGNGSLMRTIPVALAYGFGPNFHIDCSHVDCDGDSHMHHDANPYMHHDADLMHLIARRQSALTHHDPLAGECCVFYCELVREILRGKELHALLELKIGHASKQALASVNLTIPKGQLKTSGYVLDTLETALACAYQTSSFEDALVMAVNLGGDADTIGAVVGGLVGAAYGFSQIPERWHSKLKEKEEIHRLAGGLEKLAAGLEEY